MIHVSTASLSCGHGAGYVWVATIQLAPLFWVRGWDSYLQGNPSAHALFCLLSTMPCVLCSSYSWLMAYAACKLLLPPGVYCDAFTLVAGKGNMLWKLLSAITLVDFGGPEIDQAGLSRYLSESVFFPTALLPSQRLTWEPHVRSCQLPHACPIHILADSACHGLQLRSLGDIYGIGHLRC